MSGLSLNSDICEVIANNFYRIEYELEDWVVNSGKLSYYKLSSNSNAIDFLKKHPEYINYDELCFNQNPEAEELMRSRLDKLNWYNLSYNPSKTAIHLLTENERNVNWKKLSLNRNILYFLELRNNRIEDLYKLDWDKLSMNTGAVPLLEEYSLEINWKNISRNSAAIELQCDRLSRNKRKVDYKLLSFNETPQAIAILRENLKKVCWYNLSSNKSKEAIELLTENPEKIAWDVLSKNPSAYELLRDNQNKIYWEILTANPNPKILKLFTPETLKNLSTRHYFSTNIGACAFLREHPEYITDEIGKMPYIFKAVKKIDKEWIDRITPALNIIFQK
jgi:hypothetical protein